MKLLVVIHLKVSQIRNISFETRSHNQRVQIIIPCWSCSDFRSGGFTIRPHRVFAFVMLNQWSNNKGE